MSGSENGSGKGNGADLAAIYGAVLAISADLKTVKDTVRALDSKVERRLEELDRKVDRGLAELHQDVAALRGEVATYHASVIGHGVLISEHEDRLGRLERGEPPPKVA